MLIEMSYSGYFLILSLNKVVLVLLLFVTIFRFFGYYLNSTQCCVHDTTVLPYVVYNVDIWCWVVVGYVGCVIGHVKLTLLRLLSSLVGWLIWTWQQIFAFHRRQEFPNYMSDCWFPSEDSVLSVNEGGKDVETVQTNRYALRFRTFISKLFLWNSTPICCLIFIHHSCKSALHRSHLMLRPLHST
jgi:hypothetical protein